MFYLRETYLLIRNVRLLTELLGWGQDNGSAAHIFKWLGVHDGVHDVCPGWCPCGVELELATAA